MKIHDLFVQMSHPKVKTKIHYCTIFHENQPILRYFLQQIGLLRPQIITISLITELHIQHTGVYHFRSRGGVRKNNDIGELRDQNKL